MPFAVNVEAAAMPLLLVIAVVVAVPLTNVPLGPLAGAVKVTVALAIRFPDASCTVACSTAAKVVEIVADCPLPAVAVTEAATFTVKMAEVLVTLPALFVTTTVKLAPLFAPVVAGVV